ncbi:RHS repeat-associated core domain-containing protein [Kitasatospora terrestris]|uniref:Teneurin-like YD-shell domain-containing protein n=1 Tax=Kitasatospora terrestris TaxID=258051 RepID=A0ABP9ERZ6_9ACTN
MIRLPDYDPHTNRLTDQLVTRSTATPTNVDEQAYTYDLAGNLTKQTSTRLGSSSSVETQCFRCDTLDRLSKAWTATDSCAATPTSAAHATVGDGIAGGAYWTEWSFDALGNRTQQVEHSTTGGADATTNYTYNGNGTNQPHTLTSTNANTSYQYDAAGNTTKRTTPSGGTQTLNWDDAGRLTSVSGGTAGTTSYVYDANGQVLLQKDPGSTVLYLPGQQLTLTGTVLSGTRYYPLPGGGTAVRTGTAGGSTTYTFEIPDQHGTAGLALDATAQNPTWRQFTPYGASRGTVVSWADNRGFLNAPANPATGLTSLGARQYDPSIGRFISVDPLFDPSDAQQLGGYTYASSDPVGKSDPTGLRTDPDGIWCDTHQCTPEGKANADRLHDQQDKRDKEISENHQKHSDPGEREKWRKARIAWLKSKDNPIVGAYLARIKEINKRNCHGPARDGCAWANLADSILFDEYIEDAANRIDEGAFVFDQKEFDIMVRKGKDYRKGFNNHEYQMAFDLAAGPNGVDVMAHPQGDGKQFDAYVDGVPSEFKAVAGTPSSINSALKSAKGKGAVRLYIRAADNSSASDAMNVMRGFRGSTADYTDYYVYARGDNGGWNISGKVGGQPKCNGWGC